MPTDYTILASPSATAQYKLPRGHGIAFWPCMPHQHQHVALTSCMQKAVKAESRQRCTAACTRAVPMDTIPQVLPAVGITGWEHHLSLLTLCPSARCPQYLANTSAGVGTARPLACSLFQFNLFLWLCFLTFFPFMKHTATFSPLQKLRGSPMPPPGQVSPPEWDEDQLHLHKVLTPSWVPKAAPKPSLLGKQP